MKEKIIKLFTSKNREDRLIGKELLINYYAKYLVPKKRNIIIPDGKSFSLWAPDLTRLLGIHVERDLFLTDEEVERIQNLKW